MSKLKVKCASCGKVFAPSNMKQTFCTDCEKAQRAARAQRRAEAAAPSQTQQPSAPLIQGPGASVLCPDTAQIKATADTPVPPAAEHSPAHEPSETAHEQPQQAMAHANPPVIKRSGGKSSQGQHKVKTQRVEPAPFTLTDEQRQRIEARYLELANPVEFDGIRTQIAAELGAPKPVVRDVVREVRRRRGMLSWWEVQGFSGSSADLERIKAAYTPYLPLPPVGIHREIAEALGLEPRAVYRGIRKIRAQMGLPQYNALEEHSEQTAVAAMPGEQAHT
ncbi:MAG TPA: hypothetical protein VHR15_15785 [Ktedonobacterales bacterium]|jgi:hypothetical protein|nr:hypothetical protein [Ktedonobacterales bacterium]